VLHSEVRPAILDDPVEASDSLLGDRSAISGDTVHDVDVHTPDRPVRSTRDRGFDSAGSKGWDQVGEVRLNASDDVSAIENVQDAHLAHQDR
jgi:hypothetical protein